MKHGSKVFEQLALGVLEACYKDSIEKAKFILRVPLLNFRLVSACLNDFWTIFIYGPKVSLFLLKFAASTAGKDNQVAKINCIEIAFLARDHGLLGHTASQQVVHSEWFGSIRVMQHRNLFWAIVNILWDSSFANALTARRFQVTQMRSWHGLFLSNKSSQWIVASHFLGKSRRR
jgi:hypothetical protein